jgi:DNA-binding transcriptional MerR regulator
VIRQELAAPGANRRERKREESVLGTSEPEIDMRTLCERAATYPRFGRELEEYGLLEPRVDDGERLYPERDVDVVSACTRLARYGVAPRHLRSFRTSADREAGLLDQIVAPALRSRNAERRNAALEELETLAALSQELSQLLFWRALRSLV